MFIYRINKKLIFLCAVFFIASVSIAQEADPPAKNKSLKKIMSFADEAVGVQTKGQLQNITMNYGQITDTRYEDVGNAPTDVFFDFRYPRENFAGLCDDFALFFAIKENSKNGDQGNVIDAWTSNNNEDFIAKDGAYGKTHYNPKNDPNPHAEILYNGQTPYLAHSDLVQTWPVDDKGTPFWPGIFRRDPKTGIQVPGEFASDRDIYMEFDDKNNQDGNPVGIEVHEMAYTYGRVYAENALFYEFWIINKSGKELKNCYTGYYQDPDCSDYGQETLLVKDSTFSDGSNVWSVAQRDFDGDLGGASVPNSLGVTEDYTFGTVVFETPKNLGITDFHYFVDAGPTADHKLWPIITSDINNKNIAGETSNYFHGSDVHIDDVSTITTKQDLVWIIATGPFDMAPGDTVKFTIGVIVGDDDAHYYRNVWEAKKLYDAYFNGPVAPPSPKLNAIPGDGKITLYWDDRAEKFADPSTGELDFEGYKIYRSEDGGVTWGTKITDALGKTYGYVPVAQFDKKDNIRGVDQKNPLIWLGDDTGISHTWTDSSVVNGINYSYTIVSYDKGTETLYSLEGAKGDGPQVDNFVTVQPMPKPLGYIPAEVQSINHTAGKGEGLFDIKVINSATVSNDGYLISFEGTPASTFTLKRNDASKTVIYDKIPVNEKSVPIADGFTISVSTDTKIGGLKGLTDKNGKSVEGISNPGGEGSWYASASLFASADLESRSSSYQIVFSDQGGIAYTWGIAGSVAQYQVPFYVINKNTGEKVCFEIKDLNNDGKWQEGETIFITRAKYPDPQPEKGSANPASSAAQFAYQVIISNAPGDGADNPPKAGDEINVLSYNAFSSADTYALNFAAQKFESETADLSQIRVVPNPYIVVSKYESMQNVRDLKFMYLPPECTISVYTVAGVLVKTLNHNNGEGIESWNLISDWNQGLAYGVYVYVVEDPYGNKHIGKFALIK